MAQDTIAWWEAFPSEVQIEAPAETDPFSVLKSAAVDVIYRQKLDTVLTATGTCRSAIAVMTHHAILQAVYLAPVFSR